MYFSRKIGPDWGIVPRDRNCNAIDDVYSVRKDDDTTYVYKSYSENDILC